MTTTVPSRLDLIAAMTSLDPSKLGPSQEWSIRGVTAIGLRRIHATGTEIWVPEPLLRYSRSTGALFAGSLRIDGRSTPVIVIEEGMFELPSAEDALDLLVDLGRAPLHWSREGHLYVTVAFGPHELRPY